MQIDQATADRLLKCGVVPYEQGVNQLVKVRITQGQFDALVSFAYNLGLRSLSTSTLLKKLNAGDKQGAADEFGKWVNAGGMPAAVVELLQQNAAGTAASSPVTP